MYLLVLRPQPHRPQADGSLAPRDPLPSPQHLDGRLLPLLPHLQQLLRRVRTCPYALLLARHCPLPQGWRGSRQGEPQGHDEEDRGEEQAEILTQPVEVSQDPDHPSAAATAAIPPSSAASVYEELLPAVTPVRQVQGFLLAVLRHILQGPLLGPAQAQDWLRRQLGLLLRLKRFEALPLERCLQGLKTSWFSGWLPQGPPARGSEGKRRVPPSLLAKQQRLLASWAGWVLQCLVIELLRAHFYVTESEAHRHIVFFYRKPVWARLRQVALRELTERHFRRVTPEYAYSVLKGRSLGVGRLRLLPKRGGMRPIVNMKAKLKVQFKLPLPGEGDRPQFRREQLELRAVNSVLSAPFEALKLEASATRHPGALGLSVFSYDEAYRRLLPFLSAFRSTKRSKPGIKPFIGVQLAFTEHQELL